MTEELAMTLRDKFFQAGRYKAGMKVIAS